ncbi:HEAT repeat domain-containing protein [bacterium]|nr:HEAT repeat domain-containing protein [bacterium]
MKINKVILQFCVLSSLLVILLSCQDNIAVATEEKPIPPQIELDSCFTRFSMDSQIQQTYSDAELMALDRALSAMNMNRHDMSFRKDYTKAHLAFPIILDMMKNPLHIAPYMDGFSRSIEILQGHDVFVVPDVLACAMVHPGIDTAKLPSQDKLLFDINNFNRLIIPPWARMDPCPSENFHYILNAFSNSNRHVKKAFSALSSDEITILRHALPKMITWHDVFKPPYGVDEKERIDKLLEDKPDEYIDELATKVDLNEMMLAYISLPNPVYFLQILRGTDFPYDKPQIYKTPWGRMAIGTMDDDTYSGEYAILIDPGGNDTYNNCRIGCALGTDDNNRLGFFLDIEGDDRYFCEDVNVTLGASVMGVAAFYDFGQGNDIVKGGHFSIGATACGIASFMDDGGSDEYSSGIYSQGAAGYGIGVLLDRAPMFVDTGVSPANTEEDEVDKNLIQNDSYDAWLMAQGFSRQWGVGLCHGSRGNDTYHAGGVYLHAPLFNDRYQSFSQGFSIGSCGIDYAGGIAFLIDDNGNDYYLGDIYNQGVGYWYSGGFLLDKAGNDHYEMTQYGQGSGIHLAVGGIIDNAGNDSYTMNSGLGQGGSHDFAASVMMDRGGNDRYLGSTSCNGSGLTNSVGLFFDRDGNDIYGANPTANTMGGGRWARDTGSIGIFIDTGGRDYYIGKAHDNRLWTQNVFGAGLDFIPEADEIKEAAKAILTGDDSKIDIPEICHYKGKLTDEVFDELWEIATRWQVGDNSVIVPVARERLIAFGKDVIPKIDEKFDDNYGLASRAYDVILPALYENYPDEIRAMLEKNLDDEDNARKRNALSQIAKVKLAELDEKIVSLLDDDVLRGSAMSTLTALDSKAGNQIIRTFLSHDKPERIILAAANTLLKLDADDLYPEFVSLLDHEYFTVREGIISIIAKNADRFRLKIYRDLKGNKINRRTRLSLLRVLAKIPEFFPSKVLFDEVVIGLENDDWVMRAHTVSVLKHWLSYDSEQWLNLQDEIKNRLDEHREVEDDFHVLFLLDDE